MKQVMSAFEINDAEMGGRNFEHNKIGIKNSDYRTQHSGLRNTIFSISGGLKNTLFFY